MSSEQTILPSDHRRLGRRLGLYKIDPTVGKGLPLWLPNGTVIRDELEKLARELEFQAGFQRVATPHIARVDLYRSSGHLPYFGDDMYPVMEVLEDGESDGAEKLTKDAYVLRPMNCPHHHRVFAAQPRSYRDLPLRFAEYGQVYRWEPSGSLSGLSRVRGMCMNDGHIYCTHDQVRTELQSVLDMYSHVYEILGIDKYRLRLSRRNVSDVKDKYVDDAVSWQWAEQVLEGILHDRGIDYEDGPGHAAFYGPKIDIQVETLRGTEETLSTVQLDFAQPGCLGLTYVDQTGEEATPFCIHRAPFSTHERFVAYITELYQGAFPTWLAPVQVLVLAVSEKFVDYATNIVTRLRSKNVRAELAPSSETVSKRIRAAADLKIPNAVVVGDREQKDQSITLRRFGDKRQLTLSLAEFERRLLSTIENRSRTFEVSDQG